ncbi:hypothetical protein B0H21DRAFT_804053 [Amylocystis lapponica]|nr:hypothetical protein B0H21DRAFT_804053 [Amylocystis lapponica]
MFARSVVAALVALPFLAVSAQSCARNYTVQAGDWCDTISAKQNVSTYQLAVVNPDIAAACNNLQVGNSYCLGYVDQDCTTTHVVQPNDTCDAIASKYNINSTMLYTNNPQINADCDNIYVGEVLCAAPSAQVPPPPAGSSIPAATIPPSATAAVPSSAAAPTASDDGEDDGDDSNLPFCDEL